MFDVKKELVHVVWLIDCKCSQLVVFIVAYVCKYRIGGVPILETEVSRYLAAIALSVQGEWE